MRLRFALAVALLLGVFTSPAVADTFSYSFVDTSFYGIGFTYDSPVLIATDTTFTPLTCTYLPTSKCTFVEVDPATTYITINGDFYYPNGQISGTGSVAEPFFGSFSQLGTQSKNGQTLTITQTISPVSATPEPSSFVLLGTGFLGIAGVLRRRFT